VGGKTAQGGSSVKPGGTERAVLSGRNTKKSCSQTLSHPWKKNEYRKCHNKRPNKGNNSKRAKERRPEENENRVQKAKQPKVKLEVWLDGQMMERKRGTGGVRVDYRDSSKWLQKNCRSIGWSGEEFAATRWARGKKKNRSKENTTASEPGSNLPIKRVNKTGPNKRKKSKQQKKSHLVL